ncbi:cytochrome P450 [Actinosynnema sp. ALI-1.44]|uniref:cytochrome P450 n=1 Tax=Actinosynnema sp. ALI-1.44 TaxID=1933779 RepID=UPI001EDA5363|nr:cytochrome P450 [Actinosynnema sp. ALI-1.44]
MRALEPRVTEIVTSRIDAMLATGGEADLVSAFALPVPSLVICELLGVPYADRAEFQRVTDVLSFDTPPERFRARMDEFADYLRGLITRKRARPGDDLLSRLIAQNGVSDVEVVNIARLLLVAGHHTTTNMFSLGTFALLHDPGQVDHLREHPDQIAAAVEELLRYLSIIQLSIVRVTTEPVELGGIQVPAGTTVVIAQAEVNRDPTHWADRPGELHLDRPHAPHLAFGHGVHQCIGQQLARVEMSIGFTQLFTRLPGLRLAVPASRIPLRTDTGIYGVDSLPIAWDAA